MEQARLYVSRESSNGTRGRKVGNAKHECSRCSGKLEPKRIGKQRYCLACHNEWMRLYGTRYSDLKGERKKKSLARSYVRVYIRRGKIKKGPCEVCGSEKTQAHHDDYNKPTQVRWFCRPHHLQWHRVNKAVI